VLYATCHQYAWIYVILQLIVLSLAKNNKSVYNKGMDIGPLTENPDHGA